MIKTVLSSLFAVFLFALGAAGSWYFVEYQKSREAESAADNALDPTMTTVSVATESASDVDIPAANEMPIPVHTRAMSAEEVFRMGALHRKNIEKLKEKEKLLRDEELRLKLVKEDIKAQKQEIEGILKQIQSGVETGEQLLDEILKQRQALAAESQKRDQDLEEIRKATAVPDGTTEANVKDMAKLISAMTEDKAASMLKELIQKGNMELALQLLSTMEQRDAAKVLDSLNDPVLLADITERYGDLKRSPPKQRKR